MPKKLNVVDIVVLAAGLGTRMKSDVPKVLHRVCGESMLAILLRELDQVVDPKSGGRFNIVVGHGRDLVIEMVKGLVHTGAIRSPVVFTIQDKQLGTGHAVKLALNNPSKADTIAVFNGDLPLFSAQCFSEFFCAHQSAASSASLASATLPDAGQYGRVLRKGKQFVGTVEFKDATATQKKIKEYNGGVYLFDRKVLDLAIQKISTKNAQGEFYLPDVFNIARRLKKKIYAHHFDDASVLAGVNNMSELAQAQKVLYLRTAEKLMADGVFLHEPAHTYIGPNVLVGRGTQIGPFTSISGKSIIGERVRIGAHCELIDVAIGDGSIVRNSIVAERAIIGRDCAVGPMAHLRPGTRLNDDVRVGNFVEIKEASIGSHTNAAHLSYIGDAEIGEHVNLGCGFVTCNYDGVVRDGKRKHKTVIGNHVFVGSDSQVVAPITIAEGSFIASGSTVTQSVNEKDSLVLARSKQVTKAGYAKKYKRS